MEVFLERIRMLLPVLGSDLLTPVLGSIDGASHQKELTFDTKGAMARGRRTEIGFVVFKGSTACIAVQREAKLNITTSSVSGKSSPWQEHFVERNGFLEFAKDTEFLSPSAAASVVRGGGVNGLTAWKDEHGTTFKELELSAIS